MKQEEIAEFLIFSFCGLDFLMRTKTLQFLIISHEKSGGRYLRPDGI